MSSWFSQFSASDALNKLSEISDQVVDQVTEQVNQVQSSLPLDDEFVKKLTLRSADLQAEHDLIDAQETRKEIVRDYLSAILPWETRDEAREIMVEECHEVIMAMSLKDETFTGPFTQDASLRMFSEVSGKLEATEESKAEGERKLEKMGALPQLLDEFDLDAHVGLIERLFQEDENLVYVHSLLASAGKTEKIFWKNYFFHCAYYRYEKGLSVEEIWSVRTQPISTQKSQIPTTSSATTANGDAANIHTPAVVTTTDAAAAVAASAVITAMNLLGGGGAGDTTSTSLNIDDSRSIELTFESDGSISIDSNVNEEDIVVENLNGNQKSDIGSYEIVEDGAGTLDDAELDELEAEIARELEE